MATTRRARVWVDPNYHRVVCQGGPRHGDTITLRTVEGGVPVHWQGASMKVRIEGVWHRYRYASESTVNYAGVTR